MLESSCSSSGGNEVVQTIIDLFLLFTDTEKIEVRAFFKKEIQKGKVPRKQRVEEYLQNCNSTHSWMDIKNCVYTTITNLKKKAKKTGE